MQFSKKLFAFDIDGTLLNDKKELVPTTKEAIYKLLEKNNIVCLSTGRTPIQTRDIVNELSLKDFVIGSGGAVIYDITSKNTKIMCGEISEEDKKTMLFFATKYKRELSFNNGVKFWRIYFGNDINKDIKDEKFFRGGTSRNPIYDDQEEAIKSLFNENIIQVSIKMESNKIIELSNEIINFLSKDIETHITSEVYYEISPKNINKLNAIKYLQNKLNILDKDVYCFGDSDNDYEMIKFCENGIAMGNATQKIKKVARFIIEDNNTNAIFNFLCKQNLIK